MSVKTVYSLEKNPAVMANDLAAQLQGFVPMAVLYFVSSEYDQGKVAKAIAEQFPSAQSIGCSTAGEIVTGKMLKGSCVLMAIDSQSIESMHIEVVKHIKSEDNVAAAFGQFEHKIGVAMRDLDIEQYVGLILVDGLSGAEERLMDTIGNLTDVTFIGGAAGDDLKFQQTWVHADGEVYSDAAVLALLMPTQGFEILKTQSFCQTGKVLTASRVDEARRIVLEFDDGVPAVEAYAKALTVPTENAADFFMTNPLGLMVDDEPYVRSPQQIRGNAMVFYCAIKEGMDLQILQSRDIVADTRSALADKIAAIGKPAGIINFHCILRTLELIHNRQQDAYGQLFSDIPTVGLSTYGEEYFGHINQTSTMLLLK